MSNPALPLIHQALRTSFQSLESNRSVWTGALAECSPLIASVGNLAEQLRALSNVQLSNTPLKVFPDLGERLRFKLFHAVDIVLVKLNELVCSLQSVRESISRQVSAVLQLYEQNRESLDLRAMTQRSATAPSICDMLDWLQDAERHYHQQFVGRKALLQTLRADDLSLLESLPKRWKSLERPSEEENITGSVKSKSACELLTSILGV